MSQGDLSLRYFYEELPQLHLIGADSLLEFAIEQIGLPVGRGEPLQTKLRRRQKRSGFEKYKVQIILNTSVRQLVVAAVIGVPTAYYLVQEYLQRYSERLAFHWWHYAQLQMSCLKPQEQPR